MKYWKILAALCSLCCLAGCSGPTLESGKSGWNNTPAGTKEEKKEGITDGSGNFTYTGELQQIGDDENGYMQIPAGYVPFQEEDVEGLTQYASQNGKSIITLDFYEGVDYITAAQGMYAYLQQEGSIQGLAYAEAVVNSYPAYQIYGHYEDNTVLVAYFMQDSADAANSYYAAFEYSDGKSDFLACSSTFRSTADYHEEDVT